MPAHKLLVFDDDPVSLAAVRAELDDSWSLIEAESYESAIGLLYAHRDVTAVIAHMNTKHGRAGAELMVDVNRLQPRCRRILYSRWPQAAQDAFEFAHDFVVFPWAEGRLLAILVNVASAGRRPPDKAP